jgi:C_GCAxxG_C_C family probable redox protein
MIFINMEWEIYMNSINTKAIKEEAEQLFLNGDYYCSEAIIAVIRKYIDPNMPEQTIAMGSGFPVGVGGSMCICGAVSGGVITLGYFFGRVNPKDEKVKKAMALSKELYDYFQNKYKVLCCKIHCKGMELGSQSHMKQCAEFTGDVAEKTAEIIAREWNAASLFPFK